MGEHGAWAGIRYDARLKMYIDRATGDTVFIDKSLVPALERAHRKGDLEPLCRAMARGETRGDDAAAYACIALRLKPSAKHFPLLRAVQQLHGEDRAGQEAARTLIMLPHPMRLWGAPWLLMRLASEAEREHARRLLLDAGPESIEPLVEALTSGYTYTSSGAADVLAALPCPAQVASAIAPALRRPVGDPNWALGAIKDDSPGYKDAQTNRRRDGGTTVHRNAFTVLRRLCEKAPDVIVGAPSAPGPQRQPLYQELVRLALPESTSVEDLDAKPWLETADALAALPLPHCLIGHAIMLGQEMNYGRHSLGRSSVEGHLAWLEAPGVKAGPALLTAYARTPCAHSPWIALALANTDPTHAPAGWIAIATRGHSYSWSGAWPRQPHKAALSEIVENAELVRQYVATLHADARLVGLEDLVDTPLVREFLLASEASRRRAAFEDLAGRARAAYDSHPPNSSPPLSLLLPPRSAEVALDPDRKPPPLVSDPWDSLVADLYYGLPGERRIALQRIQQAEGEALPALLHGLGCEERGVRRQAAKVLLSLPIGQPHAAAALSSLLGAGNEAERAVASRKLREMGPSASEALRYHLLDLHFLGALAAARELVAWPTPDCYWGHAHLADCGLAEALCDASLDTLRRAGADAREAIETLACDRRKRLSSLAASGPARAER